MIQAFYCWSRRAIVRFQEIVELRKFASLQGVSLKYLMSTENNTSTGSMLGKREETFGMSDQDEYEVVLFFRDFNEFVECSAETNNDCGNQFGLDEINQSFGLVECQQCVVSPHYCSQNQKVRQCL